MITQTHFHGSGVPLEPGTRLRPSRDGHIYATTDLSVADAFAFRNAVYEWQANLARRGLARADRPLPNRPDMTGWILTVAAAQPPPLVDPDFRIHPTKFVRFSAYAKAVVTDCQRGFITSWRDQTRIISPYQLNLNGNPPHYSNGFIRTMQHWKALGYSDSTSLDSVRGFR